MRPLVDTVGPLQAQALASVAANQTPGAGAAFTLNGTLASGGIATITPPAQLIFTFAGNESANSFTVTGLDQGGNAVSEVVPGVNIGTSTSVLTYSVVKSVVATNAAAANIEIGNTQSASSQWFRMDEWAIPNIGIGVDVSGTVNYTVQQSFDDPNSPTSPVTANAMHWINCPDLSLVAATVDAYAFYNFIPTWIRIVMNSGSGTVTMTATQAGVVPK